MTASISAIKAEFDGSVKGDDIPHGRLGLLAISSIVSNRGLRAKDTAEFLARLMRDHYSDMVDFIHRDVGYRGLTVCSNWRTADDALLGPLDKWANAACDIMDRHVYYGGPHHGEAASYSVTAGDQYDDASVVCFDPSESDYGNRRDVGMPISDLAFSGKHKYCE